MKTNNGFEISFVFLAYVPPYHDEDQPKVLETEILKTESKTTDYLFKIFDSAIDESLIEISFTSDGYQNNTIRSLILSIVQNKTSASKALNAQKLADALYEVTDERNGTGLFTIIVGKKANTTRVVLSRFKGDEGLVNKGRKLLIDYMSEVFTKRSKHYKLAVFEDIVSDKSFWKGFSVDKQISSHTIKSISFFWVEKFLTAKTALTSAQGTMHFSRVIRTMLSKTTNLEEQDEIISGVINLRSKRGLQISVSDFCKTYLSEEISNKIREQSGNDDFFNSVFTIDNEVYRKEFGKTVLTIQDGITAYIPTFKYDEHVTETINKDGSKRVTIEGKLNGKRMNVQPTQKQK